LHLSVYFSLVLLAYGIETRLAKLELSFSEKNDLAVAYIRLKKFDDAEKMLDALLDEQPKSYYVHSNLGVLYKKKGDYGQAYEFIGKALKIKPEGHLGLGDWYLKRIKYSRDLVEGEKPEKNFLGEEYEFNMIDWNSQFDQEKLAKLRKMIFNDRHFADAYYVLGDVLLKKGDLGLASKAFMHAQVLEHPRQDIIDTKIKGIISHWKSAGRKHSSQSVMLTDFKEELEQSQKWLNSFLQTEKSLLNSGQFPNLELTLKKSPKHYFPKK